MKRRKPEPAPEGQITLGLAPVEPTIPREASDEQRAIFEAVLHRREHLRVIARAGSGKTWCIEKAVQLLPEGTSVLLMAFNKEIEGELSRRVPGHATVKTSHGLGLGIVCASWGTKVIPARGDARLKQLAASVLPTNLHPADVQVVLDLVRWCKWCLAETAEDILRIATTQKLIPFWPDYIPAGGVRPRYGNADLCRWVQAILARTCQPSPEIDFDDMPYLPARLGFRPRPGYDVVFIDEAQDLNRAQVKLALNCLAPGGRIIAVGDPRQAIYGWRGADPRSMERLHDTLAATARGVKTLPLTQSRRCPWSVARLAARIVSDFRALPEAPEGAVEERVHPERMTDEWAAGDFVISRTNAELMPLCLAAIRGGHRARVQGKDLGKDLLARVTRSEAEDIPAFLQWLKADEAREVEVLGAAGAEEAEIELAHDRADVLRTLARVASDLDALRARLSDLFADQGPSSQIVFTTAHRAKGLETGRVWLLRETFLRRPTDEEANLYYVAVTRAKRTLFLVGGRA